MLPERYTSFLALLELCLCPAITVLFDVLIMRTEVCYRSKSNSTTVNTFTDWTYFNIQCRHISIIEFEMIYCGFPWSGIELGMLV
jgi:hypothetical protein